MARPRLSPEEKARRGTLRPGMERLYAARDAVEGRGPQPIPFEPPKVAQAQPRPNYAVSLAFYVDGVRSGRVVACRWIRLACQRHEADLARMEDGSGWPYIWDPEVAAEACAFLEQLPHVEGRWASPFLKLEPWQVFLVGSLFGWRVRADPRKRRFTTLYLEVGRKSAKSTLMAGIAYYHLLKEDEPGASVICGATTGQQARMVFGIMQKMAMRSALLRSLGVFQYANKIATPDGDARPVNSKASTLDGLNPSCIILDESHAQDFALHDVLKSAQGARGNPLLLCPTTAGYDLLSVGYALHRQAEKVLDGIFEAPHLLALVYTLDLADDWRDETVWIKANPMIGISPEIEGLRRYCLDAQQVPGAEGEFRVKVCSLWMQGSSRWLSMGAWDKCAEPTLRLEDFAGQRGWIGADLAQLDDLAAVAIVFRRGEDLVAFVRCYLPADVVEIRARTVPEYRLWAEAGLLVLTDGTMIDYARIEADIRALCAQHTIGQIAFDQFGSIHICGNLASSGLPAVIVPKNARTFTGPAREIETRVTHRRFRHDGNSLLKWAASNCVADRRVDDSLLPKKESTESAQKIDPMDALLQGIGGMLNEQQQRTREYQIVVVGGTR